MLRLWGDGCQVGYDLVSVMFQHVLVGHDHVDLAGVDEEMAEAPKAHRRRPLPGDGGHAGPDGQHGHGNNLADLDEFFFLHKIITKPL